MSRFLPILAVQAATVPGDLMATWEKFVHEVRALRDAYPATRLFLFPELYLSAIGGMSHAPPSEARREVVAEPIPGPMTDRLGALARELDVWIVPGSIYERSDDGGIYNTAVAIAPDGTIRARYRKVFPWRPWEATRAGNDFTVFDVEGVGRIGMMVCYDGWFPEVARQLAWLGAEVILQPTATPTSDRDLEIVLARANAIVNQVYVVNVNNGGRPGPGRSVIVDPEGHVLQLAGDGEEYLSEVLDFDVVARVRRYGSVAMNRMWTQLDEEGGSIRLPMYGGAVRTREWAASAAEPSGPPEERLDEVALQRAKY